MRKHAALVLILALLVAPLDALFAQSRPRRVETQKPPSTTRPVTRPTPLPSTSTPRPTSDKSGGQSPQAQQAGEEVGEDEVVRVNANLVTVPVTVLDRDGRFIPNLREEDFRILEDGVEQQVAYFASVEQPFTVALVIDVSGSTRFKLEDIQSAAIAFLDQLRPDDRVMIVSFEDDIRVLAEPTSDRTELRRAVRRTNTGNGTRLYDAVDTVIRRLDRLEGRKAVVLFTDGVDTTSRNASYQSTLSQAEELDALIYPIQYDTYTDVQAGGGGGGGGGWPGPRGRAPNIGDIIGIIIGGTVRTGGGGRGSSREEYRRGGEYLRRLSNMTGGRHYDAHDLYYLEQAFTSIAEELRRQYSLGYYPSRQSQASERRQIRVRVKRPNLVVRARDSYIYKPASSDPAARDGKARSFAPASRRTLR